MSLFAHRLGLADSRIPHADRHGLLWLARGNLYVESGTLKFMAADSENLDAGDYAIPYQAVSMVLLGPGSTVSHDALRILARHGTLLAAVGDGGVKFYTAPPMGQGRSDVARAHAQLWAVEETRLDVARRMYAIRFGSLPPRTSLPALRGIEGARLKEAYRVTAAQYSVPWEGRRYDRADPASADVANQAINHAATFVEAAADIAVAAVGALPPLGFVHEQSSNAFTLDIADMWRTEVTLPLAFGCARTILSGTTQPLEREVRLEAARLFRRYQLVPKMIERIKSLFNIDDDHSDT